MEEKKVNKWILVGCAALLVLAAAFAAVYLLYKPQTVQGSKQITVSVVFEDASVKEHEITTQQEYLRGALEEQGLVEGDESEYGLFIKTVDGVTADEKTFETYLYKKLPPLDLVARTSGEMRLSNFMLYQAAYAELYFTDVLWPDFDENEFRRMLVSYAGRERKFGDIK